MGLAFWIKRAVLVFSCVTLLLFVVQLIKGYSTIEAIEYALLWAFISTAIFMATRLYYARKGVACAICQDTPEKEK